jgi:hypothetical protein
MNLVSNLTKQNIYVCHKCCIKYLNKFSRQDRRHIKEQLKIIKKETKHTKLLRKSRAQGDTYRRMHEKMCEY